MEAYLDSDVIEPTPDEHWSSSGALETVGRAGMCRYKLLPKIALKKMAWTAQGGSQPL